MPRIPFLILLWLSCSNLSLAQIQSNPKLDMDGDPLPEGAIYRIGSKRFRTTEGIGQIQLSPDESKLYALGSKKLFRWDIRTGVRTQEDLTAFADEGVNISYNYQLDPSGKYIAAIVGAENKRYAFVIWDIDTKEQIYSEWGKKYILELQWTPDCQHLITLEGNKELLLRDYKGKPIQTIMKFGPREAYVWQVHPNSKAIILWGPSKSVICVDIHTGNLLWESEHTIENYASMVRDQVGNRICFNQQNSLYILDGSNGKILNTIRLPKTLHGRFHFLSEQEGLYCCEYSIYRIDLTRNQAERIQSIRNGWMYSSSVNKNRNKLIYQIGTKLDYVVQSNHKYLMCFRTIFSQPESVSQITISGWLHTHHIPEVGKFGMWKMGNSFNPCGIPMMKILMKTIVTKGHLQKMVLSFYV